MAKYDGYGAQLQYDSTGSGDYLAIGQVRDITGPELLSESIETTAHDDNENNHRTFIAGLNDLGDLSFEIAFDPDSTGHSWLVNTARGAYNTFRLIFPDGGATTWTFSGILTSLSPSLPVDGLLSADVTIKCSGQLTIS